LGFVEGDIVLSHNVVSDRLPRCALVSPTSPSPTIDIYIESTEPLGSACSTPRAYPRTDLRSLRPWTSFEDDIANVIQAAMTSKNIPSGTLFDVGNTFLQPSPVSNEETLRAHANLELHLAVKDVMAVLGYRGKFAVSGSGNIALVGDPDFAWIEGLGKMHPKLMVRTLTSSTSTSLIRMRRWNTRQIGWPTLRTSSPPFKFPNLPLT